MISTIKSSINSNREPGTYYGFILSNDDGKDYYFTTHDTDGLGIDDLPAGTTVEFEPIEESGKRLAKKIKIYKCIEETIKTDFLSLSSSLINNVSNFANTSSPSDFEDTIHLLIRLLGIHDAFQFDRKNQAGKADGFFILENLAVMYDCTLNTDFKNFKSDQIENYINKLSQKAQITFDIRKPDGGSASKTVQISGKKRQVWIITKGSSQELNDYDGIKVKEISIQELISVFAKRVKDPSYDSDRLASDLIFLGC